MVSWEWLVSSWFFCRMMFHHVPRNWKEWSNIGGSPHTRQLQSSIINKAGVWSSAMCVCFSKRLGKNPAWICMDTMAQTTDTNWMRTVMESGPLGVFPWDRIDFSIRPHRWPEEECQQQSTGPWTEDGAFSTFLNCVGNSLEISRTDGSSLFHYVFQLTNFWDPAATDFFRRTIFTANGFGGESRRQWHLGGSSGGHGWGVATIVATTSQPSDQSWQTRFFFIIFIWVCLK